MKFSYLKLVAILIGVLLSGLTEAKAIERPGEPVTTTITEESTIEEIRAELEAMDVYILDFTMDKGKVPTFEIVTPPEGCSGLSITNNQYETGELTISYRGEVVYESGPYEKKKSGVKVKLRGNNSTAQPYVKKKSYKIKLEKKADLLFRDSKEDLRDKEWVLLGLASEKLHYVAGFQIGRELGLGWQPAVQHVAVIMNDEYLGCFYLAEPVTASKARVDIEDSGYIVENDGYWWKPDEVYFKSNHQPYNVGWTFKAPDEDDFDEMSLENIKWVVNSAEYLVYKDAELDEVIDFESFSRWLLTHDLMNNADPIGSNLFLIKDNFSITKPFESKLRMGPIWDLDVCFSDDSEQFAPIHLFQEFWFNKLWPRTDFREVYDRIWREVREDIKDKVMNVVEDYLIQNPDLHKLRLIDSNRDLNTDNLENPYEAYGKLENWLKKRVSVLDKLILGLNGGVDELPEETQNPTLGTIQDAYTLDGLKTGSNTKGLVISVDASGKAVKRVR